MCVFWTLPFCLRRGLRSGQKDDEEVSTETCDKSCVSQQLGNSPWHKVRSSSGRFSLGLDDLTLWHGEMLNYRENAAIFTCSAEQIVEGWTRRKFGVGREKRREWRREKVQETSSPKQDPKFLEVETLLLRSWIFSEKHTFSVIFRKHATSEKQKTASKFFWTDRFRDFFWCRRQLPAVGRLLEVRVTGLHGCRHSTKYHPVKMITVTNRK